MNLRAFRNEANSKLKSSFFFKTANKYILNNKIKNNQQLDKFLQIHFLYISFVKGMNSQTGDFFYALFLL